MTSGARYWTSNPVALTMIALTRSGVADDQLTVDHRDTIHAQRGGLPLAYTRALLLQPRSRFKDLRERSLPALVTDVALVRLDVGIQSCYAG